MLDGLLRLLGEEGWVGRGCGVVMGGRGHEGRAMRGKRILLRLVRLVRLRRLAFGR